MTECSHSLSVIPAQAGIQGKRRISATRATNLWFAPDSRLRGNDEMFGF
jgi:hypothetical protein